MEPSGESGQGIVASLGRLLRTLVAIAQNRLELALVEVREERWRFFDLLLLAGFVLILASMTLLVGTITIVAVCLKCERLDLIIGLTLLYLACTLVAYWRLRTRLSNWAPFSATLTELKKDKACLEEKN